MTEPPRKKMRSMRKGTRSCLECRRRKTRCIYTNQHDGSPCDGCQNRETICQSQEDADNLSQVREPTRERVDRLEVVVQNLSNSVADLQRSTRELESHVTPASLSNEIGDEVYTECESEADCQQTPTACLAIQYTPEHRTEQPQSLRDRVLDLVPSRDDVLAITASATDWWQIHNALFPEPAIKNRIVLIEIHQDLDKQDTSATSITLWLLFFAVTFLQLPKTFEYSSVESISDPESLVSRISKEAETLLMNDAEIGTLEGLKCASIFAQLQKAIGRPKKGWIMLRRAIAFAELLNLHSAKKALKLAKKFPQQAQDETNHIPLLGEKASLWTSLCAVDQLLSLLLGLPTAASNFPATKQDIDDPNDPHAPTRRIIAVQSALANQIFRRDQLEDPKESYDETLLISGKLHALQRTWPAEWSNFDRWQTQPYDAKTASCMLFQTGHSFLVLRTLLPFLLKAKDHPIYQPQAMECLQACRDILKRYYAVRTRLNVGGFMSRSFDVHAFTASVILLLHHDERVLHMSTTDQALLENAKEAMRQAPDRAGLRLTERMVVSLNGIQQCLDGDSAAPERVNLKVPLLGDVTMRRVDGEGNVVGERKTVTTKVSFNFDALDDEWFLQEGES